MSGLLKEDRQKKILTILDKAGRASVVELSQYLKVSRATIRRDLNDMSKNGGILRAFGGVLSESRGELPVNWRLRKETQARVEIAREATKYVMDRDTIFIGPGSTTQLFAQFLQGRKDITIVTNAINVARSFVATCPEIVVVFLGGVLNQGELSCTGHLMEQSVQGIHFHKSFFSVEGISVFGGWSTRHLEEVNSIRSIIQKQSELILLAVHTQVGLILPGWIAPIHRVNRLVTDQEADKQVIDEMAVMGVSISQIK